MATLFSVLWIVWIGLFALIEGVAIFNKSTDDTLSEKFRDFFHTNTKAGRSVWAIVAGLFFGLFIMHIAGSDLTFWS